jgi:hypothetical protein
MRCVALDIALEPEVGGAPAAPLGAPLLGVDELALAMVPVTCTRLFTCEVSSEALPSSV